MAKLLKDIAQDTMDMFYQNYKSDFQFFDLEDFINHTGDTISNIYQKYYELQYRDIRQERKDEVVIFDIGMLSEQIVEVKKENESDTIFTAKIKEPIMSFMYDQNNAGVQVVMDCKDEVELERTTITELWQLKYLPKTNRIFFYSDINSIKFVSKGGCNLKKVRVIYVPSMYAEALVADGVADDAIQKTVTQMRQLAEKRVVKKSLDNNENMLTETEMDKKQLT